MAHVVLHLPISHREISKRDDDPIKVFGWASVSTDSDGKLIVDHQGDSIEPAELEAAAYDFAKSAGPSNVNHVGPDVGTMIESLVLTPEKRKAMDLPDGPAAWWVGFEVTDALAKARIRSGELQELSIEGDAEEVRH